MKPGTEPKWYHKLGCLILFLAIVGVPIALAILGEDDFARCPHCGKQMEFDRSRQWYCPSPGDARDTR